MIAACGLPSQNVDDQQTELAFAAYRQHDLTLRTQMLASLKQQYSPTMPRSPWSECGTQ